MANGDTETLAVDLVEAAIGADAFGDLATRVLPILIDLAGAGGAFLHLSDYRLSAPFDGASGVTDDVARAAAATAPDWFEWNFRRKLNSRPAYAITTNSGSWARGISEFRARRTT